MAMDKTFDAKTAEPRIFAAWEKAKAFKAGANKSREETFCIQLPPPNVTGVLHVGHAFNHTLMDILTRWKRMQGYDTLFQPGLDHAGIATQLVVEKQMAADGENRKRSEMAREEFLAKVWDWKKFSGGTIVEQDKRLGSSMDYDRLAFTMSGAPNAPEGEEGNFHDAVLKVFVDMYNKGLIYRGKRLVNWDPHFETAISDLEVENIEVDGHMWHFKYPLAGGATYTYIEKDEDGNVTLEEERDYISIATTRPETMLGDGAVAVHPKDERYASIVGKLCEIPVGPKDQRRLIPIITDDYPDPDFGSGAVKITGAHDFNDYQVAKRGNIPMYALMDTKGAMRSDGRPYAEEAATAQAIANGEEDFDEAKIAAMNLVPEDYRGLDRFEARKRVVADITTEGLAVMHDVTRSEKADDGETFEVTETVPLIENKKIMLPFGDRSKVVIEPALTDQWFVRSDKIVGPALDAVRDGTVKIMPESGKKVYFHWLENIEPWCISRQLWWGHQIPVWFGSASKTADGERVETMFCASNEAEAIEQAREHFKKAYPEDFDLDAHGFDVRVVDAPVAEIQAGNGYLYDPHAPDHGPEDARYVKVWYIARDPDVLDTWFSSGLWPFGTLGWPDRTGELEKYFPSDVLITGQDILYFWVARMMMMSYAVEDKLPFHTVYLHQLVRDAKGEKMSKTRGNVLDPLEIVDAYGADALRFTNAQMAALGGVLKISEERIKGYRNFGTKLWNAFSFAEHYEIPYPGDTPRPDAQLTLNKWIIRETAKVREAVDTALEGYHFNEAANALYAFVWGKVCDWYLEFSKPILQGDDEAAKVETQQTLRWVLDQSLILLHPIMPFITEELWGFADNRAKMLVHADWPEYGAELVDVDADREMNWVISLIEGIRSARAQMNVPAGLKIPVLQTVADDHAVQALANNEALIMRLARVESIIVADEAPKGSLTVPAAGASFALPLADIIDVDAEKARLGKQLEKLGKELGGLRGRLNNPKFVESAPEAVVAEAKANLALREEEEAKLTAAIGRLEEIG